MVSTADFPQADRLEQVGKVVLAIANGRRADEEIETYIGLDSSGRQGRYYRLAAEMLGLITNQQNYAVLTTIGEEYARLTSAAARKDFLSRCLIETPVFRAALHYIHKYKPTDNQLKKWFRAFYPGAQSTADRRFVTFMNYLRDADLLKQSKGHNELGKYSGSVVKITKLSTAGITARKPRKTIIAPPTTASSSGSIRVDIDAQKRERANQTHWMLVAAKAAFLEGRGLQPYENEHVDLYASRDGDVILYEMKSVDQEGTNLLAQVRKAVAQLYEYRYIFDEPKARICLVTNQAIANKDGWLLDYLAKDRLIAYTWTENFSDFNLSDASKNLLGGFSP